MHPFIILLIGIATVIGLIIALRVNAFIALISAAILVSLLAPGELPEKIGRVARAFGGSAGTIGIVIALAAIIGKCLMDSGAADRIVRGFLRLLGEKRASLALMGSGFVLSAPVFFDTVFYLLVPLARSLWRRTRKNYMLYILAIGAGGVVTHTLVPPTPGPLLMAANLGVDLGYMIIVGSIIGLPVALVGLCIAGLMNRRMDIPMRPYSGEPEPEVLEDEKLPSFSVSILPVILPVLLISINTVTQTVADSEHAALFRNPGEVNWSEWNTAMGIGRVGPPSRPVRRIEELLSAETLQNIQAAGRTGQMGPGAWEGVRADLNKLLGNRDFYLEEAFVGVLLPGQVKKMLDRDVSRFSLAEVERLNRLLLEESFPGLIQRHTWETPRRKVANFTALLGNANMALLISAAIAMIVLVRTRGLTLAQLGKTTETALLSGGLIILITAGGGAFGAMLKEAEVGGAVQELIGQGRGTGMVMLWVGFAVASVLKIAQGSGTVSMITASGMIASMGISPEALGFHPVYLACAIGSGSLVSSWMNDSGFWIFARMSVLTEVEALKSWTILLALLGFTGITVTSLMAWLVPLV